MDSMLGVHKDRVLPDYDSARFRGTARVNETFPLRNGTQTPGKVGGLFNLLHQLQRAWHRP
jgi:hypothetical protein